MPINGYSVGRDITLVVVTGNGPVQFDKITGFSSKPNHNVEARKALDGMPHNLRHFDGWSGSFDIDRTGPEVDDYFATLEANFYQGIDEKTGTITETVTEPSGAVSQYRYTGVTLTFDNAGEWKGNSSVPMKVGFVAQRRLKIS